MSSPLSALIVAGEASGDQHAAALVASLSRQCPLAWFGLGGDALAAAGVELVEQARTVSVLGLSEVVRHLPRIYGVFRKLLAEVDRRRPRLAVLVNFPDFNLRLAEKLHQRDIPIVYFIPPQVWAWRARRVRVLKRTVRKVLCIFPFEETIYQRAGIEVEYVGHPLVDCAQPAMTREDFVARHGLDSSNPIVSLLPGSRNQEVIRHLPPMLAAAQLLQEKHRLQFLLVRAPTVEKDMVQSARRTGLELRVIEGPVYDALAASQVAVVASGTATVEAALLETPMVVVYRVAPATWWLGRLLVHTPHYSMVNLMAGQSVVPELIQKDFTPERVAQLVEELLVNQERREQMKKKLREVRAQWGEAGAIERASRAILSLLPRPVPMPVSP